MLRRGLLNKLSYTFHWYYLVNDHNDVRLVKKFLGVPIYAQFSFFLFSLFFISLCISYLA